MARIRSLKPETFISDTLARLPLPARWTFIGLWTYCDDEGRGRADPRLVKAAIWPLDDDVTPADVGDYLKQLEAENLLCRYEANGHAYLHVVNFAEHQRPNHPAPSKLPACVLTDHSRRAHVGLTEDSGSPQEDSTPVVVVVVGEVEGEVTPTVPAKNAPAHPKSPTITQRSKVLTDAYAKTEPMCNWPAVNAIAIKAIKAGRWSDFEVGSALLRLASEGRGVTVETLRTELDGLPPARAAPRPSTTDQRVSAGLDLAARYREEEQHVQESSERAAVAGRRV